MRFSDPNMFLKSMFINFLRFEERSSGLRTDRHSRIGKKMEGLLDVLFLDWWEFYDFWESRHNFLTILKDKVMRLWILLFLLFILLDAYGSTVMQIFILIVRSLIFVFLNPYQILIFLQNKYRRLFLNISFRFFLLLRSLNSILL